MAGSARTAQGRNHVGGGATVVRNGGKAGDRLDVPGVNGVRPSVKRRTTVVVATFASTPTRRTPRRRIWAGDHAGGSVNSPLRWQVGGRPFLTDPTALARRTAVVESRSLSPIPAGECVSRASAVRRVINGNSSGDAAERRK